jgi:hypothetical protein
MKTRSIKAIVGILVLIFLVGCIPKAVERYVMGNSAQRYALDSDFMAGGRLGGPFHTRSPEEGTPWNNGSAFIHKAPLPPL